MLGRLGEVWLLLKSLNSSSNITSCCEGSVLFEVILL